MKSENDLPDFLCIGAQKAATSWLWSMLRQNPQIWLPPVKELHYFDHVHIPENRSWTLGHIRKGVVDNMKWHVQKDAINFDFFAYMVNMGQKDPFTEEWYRACYNRPASRGKVLGDVTPEYSTLPEEGVEHVRRLLGPSIRIIYIIRDPVDRALSQLKMNLTRRGQEKNPESFWLEEAKDPVIQQRGDYKTYIPRWERVFDPGNILYLPYGMVASKPRQLLRLVEQHLGISEFANYSKLDDRVHRTREAKAPESCVSYFKQTLAPQYEFLKSRFDEDFMGRIH